MNVTARISGIGSRLRQRAETLVAARLSASAAQRSWVRRIAAEGGTTRWDNDTDVLDARLTGRQGDG